MTEVVERVPKLRFPEFSSGEWKPTKLKKITKIYDGTHQTPNYVAKGVPFYSVEHVTADQFSETKFISEEVFHKENKRVALERNDILMTRIGDIGTARLIDWDVRASFYVSLALLKANEQKFSSGFLKSYFDSDYLSRELHKRTIHVAFPKKINLGEIGEVDLALPSLPEQKKIAAFLGVVDAKIAALQARRAALERYKRGLMQALFSQRVRFTKPDGTPFPDWEEKRLGEVFDWVKTNSLSREKLNYDGGETQNIHYGDIHTKFQATFRQAHEQVPYVSAGAVPGGFSNEEFCQVGDVVIADASEDYADIGKAIEIVELTKTPLVAGLHTYIARPKGGLALGFSGYLLRTASMRKQIMRIAQGISVLGISKTNLDKLFLPIPHPDEQAKIAGLLSAMDAKIAGVGDQVTHMEAFKKGLLQQMFV